MARASDWLVPRENPAAAIYGVITIGAVLAAETGSHDSQLDALLSGVIVAGVYWLAHAYAGLLGRRLAGGKRLDLPALRRALAHDWALVRGALIPLVALAIAWAGGASQTVAVAIAVWSAVVSLLALELIAGVRSRASRSEMALQAAVGAAMGLSILALKVLMH